MVPGEVIRGGISEEGRVRGGASRSSWSWSSVSVAGRPSRCRPEVASRPGPGRRGPLAGRLDLEERNSAPRGPSPLCRSLPSRPRGSAWILCPGFSPVRTFPTSSRRAASGPLRAARGTPRLAASLPARRPRLRATTSRHDEARYRRGTAITGLPVSTSRTTAASRPATPADQATTTPRRADSTGRGRRPAAPAGRARAGPWPQRRCLRRVGPPALRPGDGLRRSGLLAPNPRRLWDAPAATGYPSHTGGHQTAPTWSRSFVQRGAPPGPGRRGPAGRSLRDGMPHRPSSGPLAHNTTP